MEFLTADRNREYLFTLSTLRTEHSFSSLIGILADREVLCCYGSRQFISVISKVWRGSLSETISYLQQIFLLTSFHLLPSLKLPPVLKFCNHSFIRITCNSHACYISRLTHLCGFNHPENVRCGVQIVKLFSMYFYSFILLLRLKCVP
jgi:hypothetical protein